MRCRCAAGAVCALVTLSAGCDSGEAPRRDGASPAADGAADALDGGVPPGDALTAEDGPPRTLVEVHCPRELRGAWVATVGNIDFPSSQGLSAAEQQAELVQILATLASARLNAVFFQVRPEGDALYASSLEPWSRYLTGTQGVDPGYDPLAFIIDEAHARNIEVHAWFNPYRAKANKSSQAVAPHMSITLSDHAHTYGSYVWMDPGAQVVADHTVAVIRDVVQRYDVDGVHFDDYFYPYPVSGVPFPDDATYAAYQAQGGTLARDDWRRDNVNRLVKRVGQAIAQDKPHVRFGISPFGIYRPGTPPGISGLDQYAAIYADPPLWKKKGWVDYLAPQLYWPSTQTAQAFGTLVAWWSPLPDTSRYTFPGLFLSKLGSSSSWTVEELRTQIQLTRAQAAHNALGNIFFSYVPLRENRDGIVDVLRDEIYPGPALTPPLADLAHQSVAPPYVTLQGTEAQLSHPEPASVRAWTVYEHQGEWVLSQVAPATAAAVELGAGRWAVAAVARSGVESPGVEVMVP